MPHSTLTATERTLCCILENFQTPEGVRVPEPLRPFCLGLEFIPFRKVGQSVVAVALSLCAECRIVYLFGAALTVRVQVMDMHAPALSSWDGMPCTKIGMKDA